MSNYILYIDSVECKGDVTDPVAEYNARGEQYPVAAGEYSTYEEARAALNREQLPAVHHNYNNTITTYTLAYIAERTTAGDESVLAVKVGEEA